MARINLQILSILHRKCADDSDTFVANGGHHCDEEAKRNLMEPRIDSGDGRRQGSNAGDLVGVWTWVLEGEKNEIGAEGEGSRERKGKNLIGHVYDP